MAASGSVFSETLQEITNTKLQELSKRRSRFEEAKSSILSSIDEEKDAVKRLITLSNGVKDCFAIKLDKDNKVILGRTKFKHLEVELKNLDRFLDQAKTDPSVSSKMLAAWEESLTRQLDMQALQYQYAWLYGELVTEWLAGDKEKDPEADVEMGGAFEDVGEQAKLQSKIDWENTVFEPASVDTVAIKRYLDALFGTGEKDKKTITNSLQRLRNSISSHEGRISTPDQFTVASLKWIIPGLHSSDLLSNEKREVLKDFESNDMILKEIADVLNMRINALDSWTWNSESPVDVSMQRKISGIYNIHMHEDLLQAIFLQYIGVKWSVVLKQAFKAFRDSGAWKAAGQNIPLEDKRRLGYYLGFHETSPSLQTERAKVNEERYFMAQLMNYEHEVSGAADGEEEAEYESVVSSKKRRPRAKQTPMAQMAMSARRMAPQGLGRGGAMRHRKIDVEAEVDDEDDDYDEDDNDDEGDNDRSPMALKQTLLHLLSTEITINTYLYGETTAFHSVFEEWNPKLPHDTVLTILKYLGVSDTWLGFFKKFLEAPLKFVDDDDSTARKRRRGTPACHVLSDVFGEITLFCLDFSVNQSTSSNLWRIQDNFWFWSHDHSVAVKAWETVDKFTSVTGVEVNPYKTGSIRISKDSNVTLPIDESLPKGEIRWGFLSLSPKSGRFEIDQNMVDSHINELHKQLVDKRKSILGFIQAWNTYAATFFTSNFGKAAHCFGREHVDNMLATHKKIEQQVFTKLSEGEVTSVAEYLKRALGQRFGVDDIPDGYLYFPMELGGLDLKSPFISLLQIHDQVVESPPKLMVDFEEAERSAYDSYKECFLSGKTRTERYRLDDPEWTPDSQHEKDNFMSFEEFTRYREAFFFSNFSGSNRLHRIFRKLMKRPSEIKVEQGDGKISSAMEQLRKEPMLKGITGWWTNMDAYWTWVTTFYGPEIVDRFGRLNIVNTELLPIAMVSLFRDKRVNW
ncbi:Ff.00g128770.m01.CDS01 [Fusarium sp. VM40]|nr:Ff.00g128770.m01.CDS01 [Fusarium sp. VM40]